MLKILANDGIHPVGKQMLEKAGYQVDTDHIPQAELTQKLNEYDVVVVRSATKIRKELIDQCPNIKVICRAGVGMDNIDVEYARSIGRHVVNTPAASSRSVAELVFAHFLSLSRSLFLANREMPSKGHSDFKTLKKSYSRGIEMKGKTLGVIGLGRIGCETIKIGVGMEMKIIGHDPFVEGRTLTLNLLGKEVKVEIKSATLDELLKTADYISLHVPFLGDALISSSEFNKMKKNAIIVNAARGGVIDEAALKTALEEGTIFAAGLDVFNNEPTPDETLLNHDRISLSPHIGASTLDAQENIWVELAKQIVTILG